jgi:uncharacterized membrane protein
VEAGDVATRPRWTRRLFAADDFDAIARAVSEAEARTSAEIRIHLERRVPRGHRRTPPDTFGRARDVFARLGMHRTALRHGVLIYLALEDRQVAIVGDDGIHVRVGDAYWGGICDLVVERLRQGASRAALVDAVAELGSVLARHFPRQPGDTNELSDSVSVEP